MKTYTLKELVSTGSHARMVTDPSVIVGETYNGYGQATILDANATKELVDSRIDDVVDGAVEALDTLKELGDSMPTKLSQLQNDAGFITAQDASNTAIVSVTANQPFPTSWPTYGTMSQLISAINNDNTATKGKIYLSTVSYNDMPSGISQAEMKVEIMEDDDFGKNILFTVNSENVSPYRWEYLSAYGRTNQWRSYLPSTTSLFSGDYTDLDNKPSLATVATSGSYNDLSNTPTIPTIPTNVSSFTNDAGYLTGSNAYTKDQVNTIIGNIGVGYGIRWTSANSTPYRVGNISMHKSLPIQSMMRRCMLQDDGTVYGYIDPNDYTKYTNGDTVDYTGAHGQYCVEIPEYWYNGVVQTGDVTTFGIDIYPVPVTGTKHSPKYYVSAVEATTNDTDSNESTKKLFSICMANVVYDNDGNVNASDVTLLTDSDKYIGGNRNTSYTGVKSLHGRPATSLTRANFRTRAAARGTGWSQQYWDAYMAWVRLYIVEYCSFNSQASYNANKTSDGYMQGGLGAGVSEVNSTGWNTFNGYNPFVPCGVTKRLGNATGVVDYKFAAGEFQESALTVHVPAYRGIENPFGHIWKWTDGFNAYCDGETHKTSIYTCNDPANFADNTSDNYVLRTSDMYQGTEGWIKSWLIDENADFIPLTTGGSGSSYLFDYSWANNTGWRVLGSGGSALHGARCGLFYFDVHYGSSNALANVGGRLYYTPQN